MNKRIKLAFVSLDTYPIPAIRGGAMEAGATRMMDMNEIFREMDFTVITISDPGLDVVKSNYDFTSIIQIEINWIDRLFGLIYSILRRLARYRLSIWTPYMHKVNRQLVKGNYDIVMFCTSNSEVAQVSKRVKSKIVYRVVSDYLTMQSYGIDKICERVDKFYTFEYIRNRMMSMLNIPENRFWAGNNSIDITIPPEDERRNIRREIRVQNSLNEHDVVVLYVGRLSKEKGPLELITAMNSVPGAKLIVVGGENFSSDKQTDYVKSLYREAEKCEGRIIFTGFLPSAEARKYMYAADIAVVPSVCNEAASSALLEFRVSMLPTVVSHMGGMKYNAGDNVIWVEYDDNYVNGLATAINSLVEDKSKRTHLANVARNGLELRTREHSYKRLLNWCEELLRK